MSNVEQSFQDRTALVTGGSRGIGRACCLALAERGARVAVNYRSHEQAAEETAAAIRNAGGTAHTVRADVTSDEDVQAMVEDVRKALGPIDLLVNNAGIFEPCDHTELSLDRWQRTLDINLTGTYRVTWAVKDEMIERGYGRIVNISSIAGLRARPNSIDYSVSKAGVIALTKSLSDAVAPHGVRVNAVAPGLIDTEILSGVDEAKLNALIEATPMGRIGQSGEIAALVVFLLSDAASFTTGQTLVASGGRVLLP